MKDAPTFSVGDTVRVRNMRGVWVIRDHHLVTHEVEVTRPYGTARRVVPVADLRPVREAAQ